MQEEVARHSTPQARGEPPAEQLDTLVLQIRSLVGMLSRAASQRDVATRVRENLNGGNSKSRRVFSIIRRRSCIRRSKDEKVAVPSDRLGAANSHG